MRAQTDRSCDRPISGSVFVRHYALPGQVLVDEDVVGSAVWRGGEDVEGGEEGEDGVGEEVGEGWVCEECVSGGAGEWTGEGEEAAV